LTLSFDLDAQILLKLELGLAFVCVHGLH
jgi:hypothetical protein